MWTIVGGAIGITSWFAMWPVSTKLVSRRRRDIAFWSAVSSVLSAVVATRWGLSWIGVAGVILVVGFVVLAEIDIACRRLPREISYPLGMCVVFLVAMGAVSEGDVTRLLDALAGSMIATGLLFVLYRASRGGLGDGDVRLAPALGTVAGFGGVSAVWTALFVAFLSAGVVVGSSMLLRRATRESTIAFGPFLVAGAITSILVASV